MRLRLKEDVPAHMGRALHPLMKVSHFYRPNFNAVYRIDHKGVEVPDKHAEGLLMAHSKIIEIAPAKDSIVFKKQMAMLNKMKRPELMKLAAEKGVENIGAQKNVELKDALIKILVTEAKGGNQGD